MVKFARDAQARMSRLLDELQTSLGEDTKDLVMRVGLHSGPVTVSSFLYIFFHICRGIAILRLRNFKMFVSSH